MDNKTIEQIKSENIERLKETAKVLLTDLGDKKIDEIEQALNSSDHETLYGLLASHKKTLLRITKPYEVISPPNLKEKEAQGDGVESDGKRFYIDSTKINISNSNANEIIGSFLHKETDRFYFPANSAIPLSIMATKLNIGFSNESFQLLDDNIQKTLKSFSAGNDQKLFNSKKEIKRTLKNYQVEGVEYILDTKRTFLFDQPGIGKTFQAIVSVLESNALPALIVCPATMKYTWLKEFAMTCDLDVVILEDLKKFRKADVYITNYDNMGKYINLTIKRKKNKNKKEKENENLERLNNLIATTTDKVVVEKLKEQKRQLKKESVRVTEDVGYKSIFNEDISNIVKFVVFDESHKLKENDSQRTKLAKHIAKDKEWVLMLSGTPILNHPKELQPQLEILGRINEFGGSMGFLMGYCNMKKDFIPKKNKWGKFERKESFVIADPQTPEEKRKFNEKLIELNQRMRSVCMVRRLKKDVLKELPPKIRQFLPVDISTRVEYERAQGDLLEYLKEFREYEDERLAGIRMNEAMVKVEYLKQIAARGKLEQVVSFCQDIVDSGEKLVIFAHHKEIIQELVKNFNNPLVITGEHKTDERQDSVELFQNDPSRKVIICSLKAASEGITLTAAKNMVIVELGWTPAEHEQAEDRIYRIGTVEPPTIYYFIGNNTIEEAIVKVIENKRNIANAATGTFEATDSTIIKDLFKILNASK